MGQLLVIALATFASEDLTCATTGALIAAGKIGFLPGVLACLVGIFVGDLLLYFAGRFGRPVARRLVSQQKLDRASAWLEERGARVVILSRFTPGLRLPTYVAAGLLKTRFWVFAGHFLLAAILWTPALVGASALLGKGLPKLVYAAPAVLLVGQSTIPPRSRRRLLGTIRRLTRWEFWPPWLTYLPLIPYLLCLAIRHRSLTLFTAANPGIPSGGFAGESKSDILQHLDSVPEFALLPMERPVEAVRKLGFGYPLVLKPDVGERGTGVAITRSESEVRAYFDAHPGPTIAQKYVPGLEFGIFYYRYPGEARGHILSITEKRFPFVTGDATSTIEELVLRDERAVILADLYLDRLKRPATDVPATGEMVLLAELGSHCRGAVFLNGAHLETETLLDRTDEIAKGHPGFFFGRFDVRAASVQALMSGRFAVLELNGVTAEATHIYDPAVSLLEAYRILFRQWRIAFEIGALNRAAGAKPMSVSQLRRSVGV